MPVQINELVIRAVVDGGTQRQPRQPNNAGGLSREDLIAECVEQIMALLEERRER